METIAIYLIVAYVIATGLLMLAARYIFGDSAAIRVLQTFGILVYCVLYVIFGIADKMYRPCQSVWKLLRVSRRRTRFEQIFGCSPNAMQVLVDNWFADKQHELKVAFDEEEQLRKEGSFEAIQVGFRIKRLKKEWWEAIRLAGRFDFATPDFF